MDEHDERHSDGEAEVPKFDHVNAPFAALDFADGRVRHSERLSDLLLRKAL